MNYKKGFTLIELLVVVAIIGILASIILAFLGGARDKGVDTKIQSQLKGIQNQVELYAGPRMQFGLGQCSNTGMEGTVFGQDQNGVGLLFKGIDLTDSRCYSNDGATEWVVAVKAKVGTFCTDSTGFASFKDRNGNNYSTNPNDAIGPYTNPETMITSFSVCR